MFNGIDLVTLGFLVENGDVRIGKWDVTLEGRTLRPTEYKRVVTPKG